MTDTTPIAELDPTEEINTIEQLSAHLHAAAQIELCTLPLYLYTAYSIKTKGYSQWSPPQGVLRTITGVAIEEMLHLALVRNLHIAIRKSADPPIADIKFYDKNFVPEFPGHLPHCHPELLLNLRKLSTQQVCDFVKVEAPETTPQSEPHTDIRQVGDRWEYNTIGALYRAILKGFQKLSGNGLIKWENSDIEYQYLRGFWNQFGGGKPVRVCDLKTATQAIEIIIDQGEGASSDHQWTPSRPDNPKPGFEEYSHYWKFVRIAEGIEGIGAGDGTQTPPTCYDFGIDDPKATWPLVENPKVDNFKNDYKVHALMELFNASYCYLLCLLDTLFASSVHDISNVSVKTTNSEREEMFSYRYGLERYGVAAMQGILYPLAQMIVSAPLKGSGEIQHAGPSFEYYEFNNVSHKKKQLIGLYDNAARYCPELGGDDSVRRQIDLLVDIDEDPVVWMKNKITQWKKTQETR